MQERRTPNFLTKENFDRLIESLKHSLNHSQYENLGMLFDEDELYAFGENWFGTTIDFMSEFETWLYNADPTRLKHYIESVYYPIVRYFILFNMLAEDYEQRLVCNDGKAGSDTTKYSELNESEAHKRANGYKIAIGNTLRSMREMALTYADVSLVPFRELTLDNFTIDGRFIAPTPANESECTSSIPKPTSTDTPPKKTTLEECFEHTSKYAVIMGLLVKNQFVKPGTFIWIDTGTGHKKLIIQLIKHLHAQGFYQGKSLPSNEEIVYIAKNTFGIEISIDTVKHSKSPTGEKHNLSFIGPASTY